MAVAVSATADEKIVRIEWQDTKGKRVIKNIALSGTVSNGDIATALGHVDALTNAFAVRASVMTSLPVTGMKSSAAADPQNSIRAEMLLSLTKANPIDASKTVVKEVSLPAYVDALEDSDGTPDDTDEDLAALITFLETNLTYRGGDGEFYPGSWTYQDAESGFYTAPGQM